MGGCGCAIRLAVNTVNDTDKNRTGELELGKGPADELGGDNHSADTQYQYETDASEIRVCEVVYDNTSLLAMSPTTINGG